MPVIVAMPERFGVTVELGYHPIDAPCPENKISEAGPPCNSLFSWWVAVLQGRTSTVTRRTTDKERAKW
jgi:hypothetical protein